MQNQDVSSGLIDPRAHVIPTMKFDWCAWRGKLESELNVIGLGEPLVTVEERSGVIKAVL